MSKQAIPKRSNSKPKLVPKDEAATPPPPAAAASTRSNSKPKLKSTVNEKVVVATESPPAKKTAVSVKKKVVVKKKKIVVEEEEGEIDADPDSFSEKDLATMIQMNDPDLTPDTNLSGAPFLREMKEFEKKLHDGWRKVPDAHAPRRLTLTLVMDKCLDPSVKAAGEDAMVHGVLEIQILRLDHMNIDVIDDIECLTEVAQVYMNHNFIRKMEGFEFMLTLSVLNLAHNKITRIEGIADLPIEVLDLSYNMLEGVDVTQLPCETLRYLTLVGNPKCTSYNESVFAAIPGLVQLDGQTLIAEAVSGPAPPPSYLPEEDAEDLIGTVEIAPDVHTSGKAVREALCAQVEIGMRRRLDKYEEMLQDKEEEKEEEEEEEEETPRPMSTDTMGAATSAAVKDELRVANMHQANVAKLGLEDKWATMQIRCRARKDEITQRLDVRRARLEDR